MCQDTEKGSFKSYFPPISSSTLTASMRVFLPFLKIHFGWGLVLQCLMEPLVIIKLEVSLQLRSGLFW